MYEIYCKLRDEKGVKDADVARATGIGRSTFSDWKSGRSAPKREKLSKIADFFGVPLEAFGQDVSVDFDKNKIIQAYHKGEQGYYLDPRAAEIAQEIANNKELGGLFDAARNASPEDLLTVQTMLEALKKKG